MIKVVLITDENYIKFTMTVIHSILKSTEKKISIICLVTNITEDQLAIYRKKIVHDSIEFLLVNDTYLENIEAKNHVSCTAYLKIFLPNILKDIDKVIFLDSDLVVINDINRLWVQFDDSYTIQAIWNPGYNYDNHVFGLAHDQETFNSGVMLMNLGEMRKNSDSKKLLEFVNEKNHLTKLNDQAAFNAVYAQKWGSIPLDWNVQYSFYFKKSSELKLTYHEKKKILTHPSIVHFTSNSKPWMFRNVHPYKPFFIENYQAINGKLIYDDKNLISFFKKIKEYSKLLICKE